MDDDQRLGQLEDKVEELIEIAEENNKIIRSLERTARWSFWTKLLIWIAVLVLPFIVLGPFIKALVPSLKGSANHRVFGLPSEEQFKALLEAYQADQSTTSNGQ